jgi:hypothetical protein
VWLFRVFESAFVRKLAYVLAGLLLALLFHSKAHAATYGWASPSCQALGAAVQQAPWTSLSDAANACLLASANSNPADQYRLTPPGTWKTVCTTGSAVTDPPTAAGQTACVSLDRCVIAGGGCSGGTWIGVGNLSLTSVAVNPGTCTSGAGLNFDMQTPSGTVEVPGVHVCGSDGCAYVMGPTSTFRTWAASAGGKALTTQTAVNQGTSCNYSTTAPAQPQSQIDAGTNVQDCQSLGSTISCVTQSSAGQYCGTYNGDYVCVGGVSANKCVAYASGGVACTVPNGATATSPPAPDNGTAGTPATPTAVLTMNVSGTVTTTNYYSSAVAAASHNPAVTTGSTGATSGTTTGTGTSSGASSTVAVSPNAANGDCGASGVNCTGDAALPALSTEPTAQSSLNTYFAALSSVPIVAAVGGITTAFSGSASCPTYSFDLFGHSYVMDQQCTLLTDMATTLGAIMLAVYTLTGFRIVLST